MTEATREYTWGQISVNEEEFLLSLPLSIDFDFDSLKIKAIHGSPASFFDYIFPDTPVEKVESIAEGIYCDYMFAGHTHVPMIMKTSRFTLLNPGSVGQPRDKDWRASCMVLDTKARTQEILRIEYDLDTTCRKIKGNMPHADELTAILRRGY